MKLYFVTKKIFNVLFLDTFPINLLSVQKLTQELNCDVIFSCKNIVFQDRETGTKIGEGFLENGHYFLNPQNYFCASAKSIDVGLWHRRFGHPSDKILNYILDCKNLNYDNCEIVSWQNKQNFLFLIPILKAKLCLI